MNLNLWDYHNYRDYHNFGRFRISPEKLKKSWGEFWGENYKGISGVRVLGDTLSTYDVWSGVLKDNRIQDFHLWVENLMETYFF